MVKLITVSVNNNDVTKDHCIIHTVVLKCLPLFLISVLLSLFLTHTNNQILWVKQRNIYKNGLHRFLSFPGDSEKSKGCQIKKINTKYNNVVL